MLGGSFARVNTKAWGDQDRLGCAPTTYHPAQGRRKVGPYEVHLAVGRGGIRAQPILLNATSSAQDRANGH